MINIFLNTLKKNSLIKENDGIIVGVSGGADSVCLLNLLLKVRNKYKLRIYAVHVNHGIRGETADKDEAFVKEMCEGLGVELLIYRYNVPEMAKELKTTVENAGRIARKQAFKEVLELKKADKIAVAHHKNDNAETFLMRVIRGSGLNGLSAIQYKNGDIIRPLLDVNRKDIERYLENNNIKYVNDETNFNDNYTRNFIRLRLLPLIEKELNPSVSDVFAQSAKICAEDNRFLDKLAVKAYEECLIEEGSLDIIKLKQLEPPILRRVLRIALESFMPGCVDVSFKHITSIEEMIFKKSGITVNLLNNIKVSHYYNVLYVYKNDIKTPEYCYNLTINNGVYIKEIGKTIGIYDEEIKCAKNPCCTKNINYDKIKFIGSSGLCVRSRKKGDAVFIKSMGGHKKISDYLKDLKIPVHKRNSLALLADDSEVLMIIDDKLIVNENYKANGEKNLFVHIWNTP